MENTDINTPQSPMSSFNAADHLLDDNPTQTQSVHIENNRVILPQHEVEENQKTAIADTTTTAITTTTTTTINRQDTDNSQVEFNNNSFNNDDDFEGSQIETTNSREFDLDSVRVLIDSEEEDDNYERLERSKVKRKPSKESKKPQRVSIIKSRRNTVISRFEEVSGSESEDGEESQVSQRPRKKSIDKLMDQTRRVMNTIKPSQDSTTTKSKKLTTTATRKSAPSKKLTTTDKKQIKNRKIVEEEEESSEEEEVISKSKSKRLSSDSIKNKKRSIGIQRIDSDDGDSEEEKGKKRKSVSSTSKKGKSSKDKQTEFNDRIDLDSQDSKKISIFEKRKEESMNNFKTLQALEREREKESGDQSDSEILSNSRTTSRRGRLSRLEEDTVRMINRIERSEILSQDRSIQEEEMDSDEEVVVQSYRLNKIDTATKRKKLEEGNSKDKNKKNDNNSSGETAVKKSKKQKSKVSKQSDVNKRVSVNSKQSKDIVKDNEKEERVERNKKNKIKDSSNSIEKRNSKNVNNSGKNNRNNKINILEEESYEDNSKRILGNGIIESNYGDLADDNTLCYGSSEEESDGRGRSDYISQNVVSESGVVWVGGKLAQVGDQSFYNGIKLNGIDYYVDFTIMAEDLLVRPNKSSIFKISALWHSTDDSTGISVPYAELVEIIKSKKKVINSDGELQSESSSSDSDSGKRRKPKPPSSKRKDIPLKRLVKPSKEVIVRKISNLRNVKHCTVEPLSIFQKRSYFPSNAFYCTDDSERLLAFKGSKRRLYDGISLVSPPASQQLSASLGDDLFVSSNTIVIKRGSNRNSRDDDDEDDDRLNTTWAGNDNDDNFDPDGLFDTQPTQFKSPSQFDEIQQLQLQHTTPTPTKSDEEDEISFESNGGARKRLRKLTTEEIYGKEEAKDLDAIDSTIMLNKRDKKRIRSALTNLKDVRIAQKQQLDKALPSPVDDDRMDVDLLDFDHTTDSTKGLSLSLVINKSSNDEKRMADYKAPVLTEEEKWQIKRSEMNWEFSKFSQPSMFIKKPTLTFEGTSKSTQLIEDTFKMLNRASPKKKQTKIDNFFSKADTPLASSLSSNPSVQSSSTPGLYTQIFDVDSDVFFIPKEKPTQPTTPKKLTQSSSSSPSAPSTKQDTLENSPFIKKVNELTFLLPNGEIAPKVSQSSNISPSKKNPIQLDGESRRRRGYFVDDIKSDDEDKDEYELDGFVVDDSSASEDESDEMEPMSDEEQPIVGISESKSSGTQKIGKRLFRESTGTPADMDISGEVAAKKDNTFDLLSSDDESGNDKSTDKQKSDSSDSESRQIDYKSFDRKLSPSEIKQQVQHIFSKKFTIKESFNIFLQYIVSCVLDKDFIEHVLEQNDDYFLDSIQKIETVVVGKKDILVRSSVWQTDFFDDLQYRPEYTSAHHHDSNISRCESCKRSTHSASTAIYLSGQSYKVTDFWNGYFSRPPKLEINQTEAKSKSYQLGSHCFKRSLLFHQLHHYPFKLYNSIKKQIRTYQKSHSDQSPPEILSHFIDDVNWTNNLFLQLQSLLQSADDLELNKNNN